MPPSMYAQYLRELTTDSIIETDFGFATYRFLADAKTVYLADIFVLPNHRKKDVATNLADQVADIARKQGYTKMIGGVRPSANGSTISIQVLLGYGMTVQSAVNDYIVFEKPL